MNDNKNPTAAQPLDLDKLEALARAATPQNLDTAEDSTRPTGYIECPECGGDGTVELTADYCNYDGKAMGVQFYGIGPEHVAAEAFFRAANPATILALIAQARAAQPDTTASASERCRACFGVGIDTDPPEPGRDDTCRKCNGTGRAAQPESATGTTEAGQSIDTEEFRSLLGAYIGSLEAQDTRRKVGQVRSALVAHIDAIIGDLRAQLAAKGQGEPELAGYFVWEEGAWVAASSDWPGAVKLYRVAPASAQPADDRQHMTHDEMLALCAENPAASGLPLSAQPDRGAAQGDTTDAERKAFGDYFCMTLSCDESESEELIDACRMAAEDAWMERARRAAPAYPASQPVAPEHVDLPMIVRLAEDAGFNTEHCTGELLSFATALLAAVAPSDAKGKADELVAAMRDRVARIRYIDESSRKLLIQAADFISNTMYQSIGQAGRGETLASEIRAAVDQFAKGKADAANAGKPLLPPADQHTAVGARLFLVSTLCSYGTACFQAGEQHARQQVQSATSAADAKDAARLDFMIAEECQIELFDRPEPDTLYRVRWPYREEHQREWSKTGREAIDAAMAAAPSRAAGKEGGE